MERGMHACGPGRAYARLRNDIRERRPLDRLGRRGHVLAGYRLHFAESVFVSAWAVVAQGRRRPGSVKAPTSHIRKQGQGASRISQLPTGRASAVGHQDGPRDLKLRILTALPCPCAPIAWRGPPSHLRPIHTGCRSVCVCVWKRGARCPPESACRERRGIAHSPESLRGFGRRSGQVGCQSRLGTLRRCREGDWARREMPNIHECPTVVCLLRSAPSSLRPPLLSRNTERHAESKTSGHGPLGGNDVGQLGAVRLYTNPLANTQQSSLPIACYPSPWSPRIPTSVVLSSPSCIHMPIDSASCYTRRCPSHAVQLARQARGASLRRRSTCRASHAFADGRAYRLAPECHPTCDVLVSCAFLGRFRIEASRPLGQCGVGLGGASVPAV